MKKNNITKLLLSTVLIIILTAAVGFISLHYDNIKALINGFNNTSDELAQKMDKKREKLQSEVEKYVTKPIIDISAEDERKLYKGEMSIEDIAGKYNLPLNYMKDSEAENIESNKDIHIGAQEVNKNTQTYTKAIDTAIGEGVSKMYALKAKYVSKLGEVEREVIKEYANLPKEKQNKDSKYKIIMDKINYVSELEKKCDNEVANVIATLESELKNLNYNTEIIGILKEAYKEEKGIKKSYYLSIYNN